MSTLPKTTDDVPVACNKSQLYEWLNRDSEKSVQVEIWDAIMKFRKNCTLEKAKTIQKVRKNEIIEVLKAYGVL